MRIHGSRVQNHWIAPRLTQPFILPGSIKWVPGIFGNLVVKSKLPPWSGSSLEAVEPHPGKGVITFFVFFQYNTITWCNTTIQLYWGNVFYWVKETWGGVIFDVLYKISCSLLILECILHFKLSFWCFKIKSLNQFLLAKIVK